MRTWPRYLGRDNLESRSLVSLLMLRQDDPKKCTAMRMVKFGLARPVRRIPRNSILLHPYNSRMILPSHSSSTLCAIDCSWKKAVDQFTTYRDGYCLPPLLAGNPVNYSRMGVLSTAEAVAAALYITGNPEGSYMIMNKFRWGHTFLELNKNILDEYSQATTQEDMLDISSSYGLVSTL